MQAYLCLDTATTRYSFGAEVLWKQTCEHLSISLSHCLKSTKRLQGCKFGSLLLSCLNSQDNLTASLRYSVVGYKLLVVVASCRESRVAIRDEVNPFSRTCFAPVPKLKFILKIVRRPFDHLVFVRLIKICLLAYTRICHYDLSHTPTNTSCRSIPTHTNPANEELWVHLVAASRPCPSVS